MGKVSQAEDGVVLMSIWSKGRFIYSEFAGSDDLLFEVVWCIVLKGKRSVSGRAMSQTHDCLLTVKVLTLHQVPYFR